MSLWLRGPQAACLRCLAALPNTTSSASCRRLQAGSLRSPDKTVSARRRKSEAGRAAHATRMRYPGVHVARPATFGSIYHLPIPENRKRKLRHCFRQSQLRILDAKFAIAENIAQTSQLG